MVLVGSGWSAKSQLLLKNSKAASQPEMCVWCSADGKKKSAMTPCCNGRVGGLGSGAMDYRS